MSRHQAARPPALSETQISQALNELQGWSLQSGKLNKTFKFSDFAEAMAFMVRAISFIEKTNHHPEWLNVYNRVEIWLTTHETQAANVAGVTKLDLDLAAHLNFISQ